MLNNVLAQSRRPNIILILADDLGWNDVSFHGSNQIPTPNIDALAYNGIMLNSHYVPALCTPSRASLLTGKYPTSMGMQHLVILSAEPWGLPLEETLMPQHFKRQGYATHAIGKWHLGFYKKEYTPTYRGFDTHFGYWNGFQDYYAHTMHAGPLKGYDMRRGLDVDYSSEGLYSTDVFTQEAVNLIHNHNQTQGPMFLYVSHLAPHTGNPENPFQAPEEEILKHQHIADPERRVYAAMVTKLDESVGKIVEALKAADMLDNSIILFMADNGAPTYGIHSNRGSNWPLRGMKESPWEGGVRGAAALWSPLLQHTKRVSNQMMHMSDWLPTLYSAAGFNVSDLGHIDGMDMWSTLVHNTESPRTEIFHNYDEREIYSALVMGSWKFVEGSAQFGDYDEWYGETGRDENLRYDIDKVLDSDVNRALRSYLSEKNTTEAGDWNPITINTIYSMRESSLVTCEYPVFSPYGLITGNHTKAAGQVEDEAVVTSAIKLIQGASEAKEKILWELERIYRKYPFGDDTGENFKFTKEEEKRIGDLIESGNLRKSFKCDPIGAICLFNVLADPCERINLAEIFPKIKEIMEERLIELKKSVVKPLNQGNDPLSDPDLHNGTWANWGDTERDKISELLASLKDLLSERLLSFPLDTAVLSPGSSAGVEISKWCLWCLGVAAVILLMSAIRRMNPFGRDLKKKKTS
ncbi:hypothetical protein RUM43_012413 [Polyplax serrata]|uniref:Sulfatase N-terminal domain-containing protein n=1 Tax=Polyplax serrata TaxID=468196 RepID=A0AAN8NS80_POLSC